MIKYCITIALVLCGYCGVVLAALPPTVDLPYQGNKSSTVLEKEIAASATDADGPIQRLIKIFLPNRPAGEGVIAYIQYVINLALGLVAFIAVLVLVYGFYGILFGKSEEGITRAKKIVKGTLLAIIIMGASWVIVRLMFYLITRLQ